MADPVRGTRAFILAGGQGTRVAPLLGQLPKVLAPIAGRPFIEYLLAQTRSAGFGEVVILTGVGADAVEDYIKRMPAPVAVHHSREAEPMGTAGAVRLAVERFPAERYLVMNGDTFVAVALQDVLRWHVRQEHPSCTMVVAMVDDASRFGTVEMADANLITAFVEKASTGRGWVNAGVYVIDAPLVQRIAAERSGSLEIELFPALAGQQLRGYTTDAEFIDIGAPEAYAAATANPPAFPVG